MPFPPIRYWLICEAVRVEERGKATLLGFYGISPDVTILLPAFPAAFAQLAFYLLGGYGQGDFDISTRLVDEVGAVVMETPMAHVVIAPPPGEISINLNIQLTGVNLPRPGTYRFSLIVNGEEHSSATFRVRQAPPAVPPTATLAQQPLC